MLMMVMMMMMMMMMMTCQTFIFKYQLVPTEATQLVGGSLLWEFPLKSSIPFQHCPGS